MKRLRIVIAKQKTLLLYLVAGALTTLVNYALLVVLMKLLTDDFSLLAMFSEKSENPVVFNVANTIAVLGAVIFAYFINKLMVFQTKCENLRALLREMAAFFVSRGITSLFEIAACAFLVTLLGLPEGSSKVVVTIIVILLNYLLSVKVVFRSGRSH